MKPANPIFDSDLSFYMEVKDYFLTGEPFGLWEDRENGLLVTGPQPPANELSRYYRSEQYLSHQKGGRSLISLLYAAVRRHQHRRKIRLFRRHHPGAATLLDIGAGVGSFVRAAWESGYRVAAVEPSDAAREHFAMDVKDCPLYRHIGEISGVRYDVISLWHVLEHLPDVSGYLEHIRRLLDDGGYVFLALPNYRSFDAEYYGKYWAAYDVPRHLWHFSRRAVPRMMKKHGFSEVAVYPMPWDAYYAALLSEQYKTGRKNWLKALRIGFRSNRNARKTGAYSSLVYVYAKD